MYGELVHLRARARRMRDIAHELEGRSGSLAALADEVGWRSSAGQVFRQQLRQLSRDLGRRALIVENAAIALEQHTVSVDRAKHSIAEARRWVLGRVQDAVARLQMVQDASSDATHAIVAMVANAPSAGSADWLDLRSRVASRGWR